MDYSTTAATRRYMKSQRHDSVCIPTTQKGLYTVHIQRLAAHTHYQELLDGAEQSGRPPPHTNKKWLRDFSEYKCSCVPSNSFRYCTADEEEEEKLALNAAFHSDDSLAFKTFLRVFSFVLRKKGKKGRQLHHHQHHRQSDSGAVKGIVSDLCRQLQQELLLLLLLLLGAG